MNGDQRTTLSSYASRLLSEGRIVFSANEAEQALGVKRGAFLDAAERLHPAGKNGVRPVHPDAIC